jgi:hypothetical protein
MKKRLLGYFAPPTENVNSRKPERQFGAGERRKWKSSDSRSAWLRSCYLSS